MNHRVLTLLAACAAFLFPTIGTAKEPPKVPKKAESKTDDKTKPSIEAAIKALTTALEKNNKTLGEIKKSMVTKTELSNEVTKQVSSAVADKASAESLASLKAQVEAQSKELDKLRLTLGTLTKLVNAQGKEQQELLDAIANQDKDGKRIASLSNMVKSPAFKKELTAFVRKTQINAGTLEISNETRYDQMILVNQRRFRIPANTRRFRITVPVGVVVTELIGQEQPRRWVIKDANSTKKIRIQPARRVSLQRPVVVRRPVLARRPVVYVSPYLLP